MINRTNQAILTSEWLDLFLKDLLFDFVPSGLTLSFSSTVLHSSIGQPYMNKELMLDRDFIRCSVVVAEFLIKYKSKEELNNSEESDKDSDIHIFLYKFYI